MAMRVAVLPVMGAARPDQAPVGLEHLVREMPGVRDVSIDPIGNAVRVEYDDAQAELGEISRLLAAHGYPTGAPVMVEGEE